MGNAAGLDALAARLNGASWLQASGDPLHAKHVRSRHLSGLADVRAAVAGYRAVSLVGELANAREVLRAAGIAAELPAAVEQVPGELRELFGWVVREGVTNAVRHSGTQHLRITLWERTIEVLDDGPGHGTCAPGSGLTGLRERAAAIGGRVLAERQDPGFRLRAEVPV